MVWLENHYHQKALMHIEPGRRAAQCLHEPKVHLVTGNVVPVFVSQDPVMIGVFPNQLRETERNVARASGMSLPDLAIAWDSKAKEVTDFPMRIQVGR